MWVYPLHEKSDVYAKFIHFRALFGNLFNTDIKAFQCDNGGEYGNHQFHQLYDNNDIQMRFLALILFKKNGMSERLRTINNIVHTILFHARLPPGYWVEALQMAEHLINILPSTIINNDTPFHKLYRTNPTYLHFRVFWCLCFPSIVAPNKLSHRSIPCVFLGCPTN